MRRIQQQAGDGQVGIQPDLIRPVAAIEDVSWELGGVLGVTLLGGLMTAVYSHSLVLPANLPVGDLAYDSIDEALRLAGNMGADSAERLTQLARGAFDQAFIAVLIAAALLTTLSAGVLKFALRKKSPHYFNR